MHRNGIPSRRCQGGFTYLGVLALVAILSAVSAATAEVWHTVMQREKEKQLLFIGEQYAQAITRYYRSSAGGVGRYPASLDDLLKDPRYPDTRRYLRRIWVDPMTGQDDWVFVRGQDGGIMGVHSQSEAHPIKIGNFGPDEQGFEGAESYADWVFMAQTGRTGRMAATAGDAPNRY